jgi:hypothetical protein
VQFTGGALLLHVRNVQFPGRGPQSDPKSGVGQGQRLRLELVAEAADRHEVPRR